MENIEKLKELFNSNDFAKIETGIGLVISLNDKNIYKQCLKGWEITKSSNKAALWRLNFNNTVFEASEIPIIKKDDWNNYSRTYIVLSLMDSMPEDVNCDDSLNLEKLEYINLRGVGFKTLPKFLKNCTNLKDLSLDDCNFLESIDDVELAEKIFNHDPKFLYSNYNIIKCDKKKIIDFYKKEFDTLPVDEVNSGDPIMAIMGDSLINGKTFEIKDYIKVDAISEWLSNKKNSAIILGISIFEVSQFDDIVNKETLEVIDYLNTIAENMSTESAPETKWGGIQVEPLVKHLIYDLKYNKSITRSSSVNIAGDWEYWYLSLLDKVSSVNNIWYLALLIDLKISSAVSVMGGDSYSPNIMYDGSIMIRNHHRVIMPQYFGTIFYNKEEVQKFLTELNKISKDSIITVSTINGEITQLKDPTKISQESILNGNNFISIFGDFENCSDKIKKYLNYTSENSRAGILLRVVNNGIVFYKTSRASDDIDFALEYLSLISFGDQGLNEGELPYNTELNVFKSDMFQDSSYDQEVINKRKPWMYERVIASIDLDGFSRKKLPGLAKNSSLGSSNLDILVSTFCNYMQKESTKNLAWTTGPVFTKNKKYPVQYGSEDVSFYRKNSYQVGLHFRLGWEMQEYSINQLEIFPAIILGRIFERYIDIISYNTLEENQRNDWAKQREDAIAAGANLLELEQEDPLSHKLLFYKNLLDVNNLCFKFNLLKSSFSEESITLFKEHFGDRSVEGQAFSYSDTTISASINLEQDRETVHSDSDLHPQGVIKLNNADFEFIKSFITDYVTNECDGDWESVSDSFYNCFSLYFKMPSDVWIDFQTLAKELTNSELNEEFDEFEGLLSDFVGITIPESGVYQGFDSGDFDSGNM